jgi:hypothetical protein
LLGVGALGETAFLAFNFLGNQFFPPALQLQGLSGNFNSPVYIVMDFWDRYIVNQYYKGKGIGDVLEGSGESDYAIAIPSYNRVDGIQKKTLSTLKHYKIEPSRIYIFVNTDEQKKEYEEKIPKDMYGKIIASKQPKGIMNVRNFVSDYFPMNKHYISMDDDVLGFKEVRGEKLVDIKDLRALIKKGFDLCKEHNYTLWGLYPVANAFYMKSKDEYTTDLRFIVGGFVGIINKRRRVHLNYKDDYERSLEAYKKDGGVIRFNHIAVKHSVYSKQGGVGLDQKERLDKSKADANWLMKKYPGLVRLNPLREGEVLLSKGEKKIEGGVGPVPKQRVRDEDFSDTNIYSPAIRSPAKVEKLKTHLLEVLRDTTIPAIPKPASAANSNRGNKLGTIGRTMTLGFGDTRHGIKQFSINKKYPELLKALVDFGNAIVPKGFEYNAITINEGVKAKKHIDSKNGGVSYIIGIGDFTGGNIKVWDENGKNPKEYDLNGKPVGFNGGLLYHQTTPFKGERYTIIYYKQIWEGNIEGHKTIGSGMATEYDRLMSDGAIFA